MPTTKKKRGNCDMCHRRDVPIVVETQLCISCYQAAQEKAKFSDEAWEQTKRNAKAFNEASMKSLDRFLE